jgi:hypothetical protein
VHINKPARPNPIAQPESYISSPFFNLPFIISFKPPHSINTPAIIAHTDPVAVHNHALLFTVVMAAAPLVTITGVLDGDAPAAATRFFAGVESAAAGVTGNPLSSNCFGASVAPGATVVTVLNPCSLKTVFTSPAADGGEGGEEGEEGGAAAVDYDDTKRTR